MSFTYDAARKSLVDRARAITGDVFSPGELVSDEEILAAGVETLERDFLAICYKAPAGDATTAATVDIRYTATDVEFALKRDTDVAEQMISLSKNVRYDYVFELLNWIASLAAAPTLIPGWSVGIVMDGTTTALAGSITSRRLEAELVDLEVGLRRRSRDLAVTGSAIDVFGAANELFLGVYNSDLAAAELLEQLKLRKPQTWSDGRVSWTRDDIERRIRELRGPCVAGVSRAELG